METTAEKKYTAKDFTSDQEVRWCPGRDFTYYAKSASRNGSC